MSAAFQPYLSVVAASRNDDHGGDPLRRTQIFINCLARQAAAHRLPVELILVDWNPVPGRPGLAAVLQLPAGTAEWCQARVITVPAELHARIKYGEKLPFFQMIAKNVGIRRARGRFILATNIDIIFSAELMAFIGHQQLDPNKQYRVDRYDIQAGLSEHVTLEETIAYAWANPIRQHRRFGPAPFVRHIYGNEPIKRTCQPDPAVCRAIGGITLRQEHGAWLVELERTASIEHLHTNACGDFTLLSREAWHAIHGYAEWGAYSFNIDSMGIVAAHYAGYEEVTLLPPCVCFHIEHSLGSGWTPEGEKKLFNRLRTANILNPDWPVLLPLVDQMRRERRALPFNHSDWGLGDLDLADQPLGDPRPTPPAAPVPPTHTASAINPAYDLDRLTLAYERQLAASGNTGDESPDLMQLFVPDAQGGYSEENSRFIRSHFQQRTSVVYRLDSFPAHHRLRLDPVARPGLLELHSVTVLDIGGHRQLARWDARHQDQLIVGGTAQLFRADNPADSAAALHLLSTGDDPQIVLPALPEQPRFPIAIVIDLRFLPAK